MMNALIFYEKKKDAALNVIDSFLTNSMYIGR